MSRRRIQRRLRRGFTLVELMVALVAGIVIAMAVVALAKTATNSFHEQVRVAAVEASLRTAAERLRNDLLRTAYMGTGNVRLDPKIALRNGVGPGARYSTTQMADLQGLRIQHRGSSASGHPILSTVNGLFPDAVEIAGNLSTDDSYNMKWLTNATGGPHLTQRPNADAAVQRLIGGPNWSALPATTLNALVQAAFVPVAGRQYFARVVDRRGCHHYVEVSTAGWDGTNVFVDVVSPSGGDDGIVQTKDTGDIVCGGNMIEEEFQVSPITRVRWSVAASANPRIAPTTEAIGDKFNLQREILDTSGTPIGTPEIVAENTIDLKFGAVVDVPVAAGLAPNIVTVDMDPDTNAAAAETPAASTTISGANQKGPHRVRAVRYRLTMRSALPDQKRWMDIFGVASPYVVRYCTRDEAPKETACTEFARARSLVTEVALINQARFNY